MYITVTAFQWLLGFRTPVHTFTQVLYEPSHLLSPGICISMVSRKCCISTLVPIGSKVLLGFENMFCTEWSTDEELTSNLGWQPRLSFIYYLALCPAVCPPHTTLPTLALQLWLSHLALQSALEHKIDFFLFALQNSSHWLWLQRSVRLRLKLPWKHLNKERRWMERTRMTLWWRGVCLGPVCLFACAVLNTLCPACHSSRRVSHTHNYMPFRAQTPNM